MTAKKARGSRKEPDELARLAAHTETFLAELKTETDRGVTLVIMSHLDELLKRAIQKQFRVLDDRVQGLFGPQSALGTVGSRITVAYGLGLYGPGVLADLDAINDMRRDYAHRIVFVDRRYRSSPYSLDRSPHRDKCSQLVTPERYHAFCRAWGHEGWLLDLSRPKKKPRDRLIQTGIEISLGLTGIVTDTLNWYGPSGPIPRDKPHPSLDY